MIWNNNNVYYIPDYMSRDKLLFPPDRRIYKSGIRGEYFYTHCSKPNNATRLSLTEGLLNHIPFTFVFHACYKCICLMDTTLISVRVGSQNLVILLRWTIFMIWENYQIPGGLFKGFRFSTNALCFLRTWWTFSS